MDKARSREAGGTGLGLAIVRHIALLPEGQVEAESHAGEGSVFRLTLPGPREGREPTGRIPAKVHEKRNEK